MDSNDLILCFVPDLSCRGQCDPDLSCERTPRAATPAFIIKCTKGPYNSRCVCISNLSKYRRQTFQMLLKVISLIFQDNWEQLWKLDKWVAYTTLKTLYDSCIEYTVAFIIIIVFQFYTKICIITKIAEACRNSISFFALLCVFLHWCYITVVFYGKHPVCRHAHQQFSFHM